MRWRRRKHLEFEHDLEMWGVYIAARMRFLRVDPTELARIDWLCRPTGWDEEREQHWRGLAEDYMREPPG